MEHKTLEKKRTFALGYSYIGVSLISYFMTLFCTTGILNTFRASWPDPSMHTLHIHDINGMGMTSYYAALKQGICQFECTLGGIGGQPANQMDGVPVKGTGAYYFEHGRTGLVSTEDFAAMLTRMGIDTGLDQKKLITAGRRAEQLLGRTLDSFVVTTD